MSGCCCTYCKRYKASCRRRAVCASYSGLKINGELPFTVRLGDQRGGSEMVGNGANACGYDVEEGRAEMEEVEAD